jgi:hypothetical protein
MPAFAGGRRTGIGCGWGGLYDSIDSFRIFMMRRHWTFRLKFGNSDISSAIEVLRRGIGISASRLFLPALI